MVAAVQPTLGCRRLADVLAERGLQVSGTTVQRILNDHGLGRRAQRVARAARHRRPDHGPGRRSGAGDAVGVLPLGAPTRGLGGRRQLLHRPPQGRREGLSTDRGGHRHPPGHDDDRPRPGHHGPQPRLRPPRPPRVPAPRVPGHRHAQRQRPRVDRPRLPQRPHRHGHRPPPHPAPLTEPQRRVRTLPRDRGSKSAGGPPSTAAASPRSRSSRPRPTPGSSATTTVAATTATSCAAAHPARSSTATAPTRHPEPSQRDHLSPRPPGRKL